MKIDRTKFTAQYENGVIKTMWVSVEVSMDSGMGEDPKAALGLSKKISDEWYQQQGGWIYNANLGTTITDVPEEVQIERPNDARKALMQDMRSCQEVKVLESYRLLAKSDPELQLVYDIKMDELTSKQ
jgi:hypothetical protein